MMEMIKKKLITKLKELKKQKLKSLIPNLTLIFSFFILLSRFNSHILPVKVNFSQVHWALIILCGKICILYCLACWAWLSVFVQKPDVKLKFISHKFKHHCAIVYVFKSLHHAIYTIENKTAFRMLLFPFDN